MITRQSLSSTLVLEGNSLYESGRRSEATDLWREAIEVYPENADAHNAMGVAFEASGNREQAIIALRQALEINPNHPAARRNLDALSAPNRPQETKPAAPMM